MQRLIAAAASLAATLAAGAAWAQAPAAQDTYNFSYTLPSGTTDSGMLTGALERDGDTFDITGVKSFSVNGAPFLGQYAIFSTDRDYDGGANGPMANLSGTFLDFTLQDQNTGNEFSTAVGDIASTAVGGNSVAATDRFGGNDNEYEAFVPAKYTASFGPAGGGGGGGGGPEPSTWALMMVGVFGAGAALRGRQGEATEMLAA